MLTITDAERAFYESVMGGVLADKPYSLSDLRLAYFLWRLDGGGGAVGSGNSTITGIELYATVGALPSPGVVGVLYIVDA